MTIKAVMLSVICAAAIFSYGPALTQRAPELKTTAPFDPDLGSRLLEFCSEHYGSRIAEIAATDGYVDLRSRVGCTQDCLRDFLRTGVDFVEAEMAPEHAGGKRQSGPFEHKSYSFFPPAAGKYRYFQADNGDPACDAFDVVADEVFRNRIGLSDGRCIATNIINAFSAEYAVETVFSKDTLDAEGFAPNKYTMTSTVVRHRKSGKITAENSSVNLDVAPAEKDAASNHSGDVHLTCKKDFPSSFLRNAFDPVQ